MKKKLFIFLLLIICLVTTACGNVSSDALKFKEEYESLNGEKNDNGNKHRTLNIPKDNPFVYATAADINNKIDKKDTFIVYFGFSKCPWCRSILEQFIKVAKDNKVNTIYYVDVLNIRDVKEVKDGEVVTTTEGDKDYMALLEKIGDVLEEYTLTEANGNKVDTNEKRIYAPNIVVVSRGKAIKMETGIADDLKDPYSELTTAMRKDTYDKLKCIMKCFNDEQKTCSKTMC